MTAFSLCFYPSHPELVSAFGHPELVSGSIVMDAEINSA